MNSLNIEDYARDLTGRGSFLEGTLLDRLAANSDYAMGNMMEASGIVGMYLGTIGFYANNFLSPLLHIPSEEVRGIAFAGMAIGGIGLLLGSSLSSDAHTRNFLLENLNEEYHTAPVEKLGELTAVRRSDGVRFVL